MKRFRLGIDVGGTFTDVLLLDEGGQTRILKVPTDPENPEEGVVAALARLFSDESARPDEVEYFVHGTTLALNTLLQRSGAAVGLLVTSGFEDMMEIGRARLPIPNEIYVDKPRPIVPRNLVRGIAERVAEDGSVKVEIDLRAVIEAAESLIESGVTALAICFLHSYRNPIHEQKARAAIEEHFPEIYVCPSTDLLRQQREYERALVASINAHVGEKMRRYFNQLGQKCRDIGIGSTLFSTKSNGGVMTASSAAERPVETLMSGPAAGVVGATFVGKLAGFDQLITLDIGGTSADVSIVDEEFGYSFETQIGDFPILVPTLEISSIGAGGGSVAWLDRQGILKVGPESAGSRPGPACYGLGGQRATITDAYVAKRWIEPDSLAGGSLHLDVDAANSALHKLGNSIQMDETELADAIVTVATSNMYAQIMPLLARAGVDPREFVLLTYGGAGPTHGFLLAREVGISRVVVPQAPGMLCAFGCLVAELKADFVQTLVTSRGPVSQKVVEASFLELEEQADAWLRSQKANVMETSLHRFAEMRYQGQSFEIQVPLDGIPLDSPGGTALSDRFNETYQRIYRTMDPRVPAEVVNVRVQIQGRTKKPQIPMHEISGGEQARADNVRTARFDDDWIEVPVYRRDRLKSGDRFSGPCIVVQYDTTSVIPKEFEVRVDEWGNLIGTAVSS